MQNTAKVIDRLPSLPSELQVLVLKRPSGAKNNAVHRAFLYVRESHVSHVSTRIGTLWVKDVYPI